MKIKRTDVGTLIKFVVGFVAAIAFLTLLLYPCWRELVRWMGTW